ncbi:hypothetical protein JQT66_19060 [Sulfitobacter mediterraneus]|uniref:hypothetical protein n=1 Tax=Sulfitobacter mediterraneus TaxID=83219 RepID=UPI00193376F2|nr:hypothetical protein [Sulfitobacter mediterraneus]MBM1312280.1 hypothetical protein [Sulfitobacter mediterraneus]MBM1316158.1 hypothetical protein [Sulfitobacter mediterraneus]MBM1324523.1 hypothetical protein [Sulfitobacter mediterraneus]MBM1328434.1 hypothetical protein [Sulfitobacter mediterraneus]MBM1399784.1 hypothetical protein [Sulfitobacter mediterraneus]
MKRRTSSWMNWSWADEMPPTATSYIDMTTSLALFLLVTMMVLFVRFPETILAALEQSDPEAAVEADPDRPALWVEIRETGFRLRAGPGAEGQPPEEIAGVDLPSALSAYAETPGPIAICVAPGVEHAQMRPLHSANAAVLGTRLLIEDVTCGDSLQ